MIGTKRKDIKKIEEFIKPFKKFYLIGCGDCATVCKTGGEGEVKEFKRYLEKNKKEVAGWHILDEACDLRLAKKLFRQEKEKIEKADVILVFACGSGVQTVAESTSIKVLPMLDSIFIGGIENLSSFKELCSVCGDCILDMTTGLCPVTRCPKGLVNGPCGGSDNGKCEENQELDCIWYLIYERLKKRNELDTLKKSPILKNFQASKKPRSIKLSRR